MSDRGGTYLSARSAIRMAVVKNRDHEAQKAAAARSARGVSTYPWEPTSEVHTKSLGKPIRNGREGQSSFQHGVPVEVSPTGESCCKPSTIVAVQKHFFQAHTRQNGAFKDS